MRCQLYIHKAFLSVKLVLIVLLGCATVKTVVMPWRLGEAFEPASAGATENAGAVETNSPVKTSLEDYSPIIQRNIFSNARSSLPLDNHLWGNGTGGLARSAGQELGLALLGTVSGNPVISRAIIKDIQTKNIGLYKTGDIIATARIESIGKEMVILVHRGQRKILNLTTSQSKQEEGNNAQARSTKNSAETVGTAKTNPSVKTDATVGVGLTNVGIRFRDIETILQKMTIEPYVRDGQVEGLQITGFENMSMAKGFGLKNGDIIREVNGQRLSSKQKAFQVLQKAKKQANMDIELLRDNEKKTLSFSLR